MSNFPLNSCANDRLFSASLPLAPPRDLPNSVAPDSLRHSGPTQPPQRVWLLCNDRPLCSRLSSVAHADCKYGLGQLAFLQVSTGHWARNRLALAVRQRRSGVERKMVVFRDGGAALGSQRRGRARRFDASLLGKPIQCRAAQAKPSRLTPPSTEAWEIGEAVRLVSGPESGSTRAGRRWWEGLNPEGGLQAGHPGVLCFRPLRVRRRAGMEIGKQLSSVGQ